MSQYQTLTELLESKNNETAKGITFILGETEEVFVSYRDLYQRSSQLLYHLQKSGYQRGDEVILQIDDNERFVYAFWACILGGLIPVPITTGTNDEHKLKVFKILKILKHPRVFTTVEFLEKLNSFAIKNGLNADLESISKSVTCLEEALQAKSYGDIYHPKPEETAFIQFSSGSTGDPKGVVISHSNVLANLSSVLEWDLIDSEDIGLNWMPLTHDMGLIGTHIKGILANLNQFNIQTSLFIRHPLLWMKKANEHKATLLYSPNFGFRHFLKFYKPDRHYEWDLSNIRLIYNGAEPISLELCNEFLDKMSVYGLKRQAMRPVYGLAEGTIAVTFPKLGEELSYHILDRNHLKIGAPVVDTTKEDKNAVVFMDEGYPLSGCYLRICDEDNIDLGENRIGYVQIRGKNVTSGYYNNQIATDQTITADGWLNTGDLGFIRNERLVITGRAKDVIFIAGQNYYAHDIERVCESGAGIELGKIAAIGVFNQTLQGDELVLFVLHKQKPELFIPTIQNLKKVVSQRMGIEVSKVIPVKSIPKTTSGKVQRFKLRESYLNGEYDSIINTLQVLTAESLIGRKLVPPSNSTEKVLLEIWTEILDIKNFGIEDDFFELGGDSLRITQLLSRLKESFGVDLEQTDLFQNSNIRRLAKVIKRAQRKQGEEPETIKISSTNRKKWPLSFGQQRIWFLDRLNLSSPQYNLSVGLVLKGNLNREALVASFNEIIKRHLILQVSFGEENGEPFQILNSEIEMVLAINDLTGIPERERRNEVLKLAAAEARLPFNLAEAPLIRGRLIRVDPDEHLLVLVTHHIIFDGWSFGVLLKEVSHCYEAFLKGSKPRLPDLAIEYFDFAQWQRQREARGGLIKQLNYWRQRLGGKLPVLDLPSDKQRPAVLKHNGAKFTSVIPGELVGKLQLLAKKSNATLFMVLLAAFKTLIYRYTGQSDLIVGSPIANRNRSELEGLIGFFTNNIVLRTNINHNLNFSDFLSEVKKTSLEAYANQDLPFEKLVEELHVERDLSRNPLFQVLFSFQNTPLPSMDWSELNVSWMDIDNGYARFDLALDIRDVGNGLAVDFEYNTDLFLKDTISRMAGHYQRLLTGIAADPERMLDEYDLLSREESKAILRDWNATAEDFGAIANWVELFAEQATRTPEAIAVVCGGQQLSYRDLEIRSNQLANYLLSKGVKAESILGIYVDRSLDMIVGLLGIHKAGAAYLPLDPIFPQERLAYMLEDAKVSLIISERKLAGTLPDCDAEVISIDTEWPSISKFSSEKPIVDYSAGNLAYLIYTSGSTGKPKGVQIEQRSLINFLKSMAQKTQINSADSLLAVTTLSFDIAGLELFLPLISGARVVLGERDDVNDGNRLIELLQTRGITILQGTPATWRLLIEAGWSGTKGLKVLCGGEALPRALADQLLKRCSSLFNVYGPTETTIWSTLFELDSTTEKILVGKPLANTEVYVVDKAMNPVPMGVPGELLIGGAGLARGYLNRPELTEEKFIPNIFSKKDSARLYRTGDLVKFTSDGNLEFIGRIDNQIKIRGFRIELGEIEALLGQNPAIKENVVVAKEIIPGEQVLVAYIIPVSKKDRRLLTTEKLRLSLKEKLPDYMVPSIFMLIEAFPMTPNGKIDRKALPIPDKRRQRLATDYSAPADTIEKTLAAIWQEVLKLEQIGVNDNFFDLGGHSLLLAQVKSKIDQSLHREVSMMELFEYPTIRSLARCLAGETELSQMKEQSRNGSSGTDNGAVAIIGLSGKFPGARDIAEFWRNLCNGVEAISRFTAEEVIAAGVEPELLQDPNYVKAWGALDDIDRFDAQFFGYTPREAEVLDPQQRLFLEECWKGLENAGYDATKFQGLIGVYASMGMNTYAQYLKETSSSIGLAGDYRIMISNDKDFLATRVAYKLNLEGPGVTVQSACSSSLVAIHLACQSLRQRESDLALAGGVSIRLPQKSGYLYQEGMILSPDGHCRAFDAAANGTVGGNGVGVVVLKRLEDAVAAGDNIWAVIKGSAINNDGALKIGYTAPSIQGQAGVIAAAQAKAGVDPGEITYIEAHGTGTPLGDPIEFQALTKVFTGGKTVKENYCALGSVKTNIGHLDAAAGVAGLIKTVLALRYRKLPPSLNFKQPNPQINLEDSPFYINNTLRDWKSSSTPLKAGVSSFGIGGTNAHVVLEEAPVIKSAPSDKTEYLLIFSAKTKKALNKMALNFAGFLKENTELNLADIEYTLQMGRREFEYRRFLICSSIQEAVEVLEDIEKGPQRFYDNTEFVNTENQSIVIDNPGDYSLRELGWNWIKGATIDWEKLYTGQSRKRVDLPTYPFERQSYWAGKSTAIERPVLSGKKRPNLNEWFYTPIWKQSISFTQAYNDGNSHLRTLLVLKDRESFSDLLVHDLRKHGHKVITVTAGGTYRQKDRVSYQLDMGDASHYRKLLADLAGTEVIPEIIVNLLGLTETRRLETAEERLNNGEMLFYSMMYLAQAIGEQRRTTGRLQLKVITNNTHKIFNEAVLYPEKILSMGACRVIPLEYPSINCAGIDCVLPELDSPERLKLVDLLIAEILSDSKERMVAYRGLVRWHQDYEPVKLDRRNTGAIRLKKQGVYVITGGMGGLGTVIADYLAETTQARLVLIGRSEFPDIDQWDNWLKSHSPQDRISRKIKQLQGIKEKAGAILIYRADVSYVEQLEQIRDEIIAKYGEINGLIHAAGIPGGGMIQLKQRADAAAVLSPKVRGGLNVYEVFKDCALDFMVFCASLNGLTGGFGQIDYSAANAYLDTLAWVHDSPRGTRFVSIDWDRWPGVGMASGLRKRDESEEIHTLLGRCIVADPNQYIYSKVFQPGSDWVLGEHLVLGIPTVPGTTYLEMARAAWADITGNYRGKICDVLFLNPLAIKSGKKRTVYTIVSKNGADFEFRILSQDSGGSEKQPDWLEHVRGKLMDISTESERLVDIQKLKEECGLREVYSQGMSLDREFISFGRRWSSLKYFSVGDHQGFAEVEIGNEFLTDLDHYQLHPALLDVATGAVRLAAGGNYLPFSYGKINIKAPLGRHFYVHLKFENGFDSHPEVITSNIEIIGADGRVSVEIRDFTMKLVGQTAAANLKSGFTLSKGQIEPGLLTRLTGKLNHGAGILAEGITIEEGRKALELIFNGCYRPQIIVSTKDLQTALQAADYVNQPFIAESLKEAAIARDKHARPELETEYVPPKNETEKKLAEIWQIVLNIEQIGIHDDFFALGGDSLLLIEFHTKLKETFRSDIAVVDLYKYNTIASLARYLTQSDVETQPAFEAVNSRVSKQLEIMKQRRKQMIQEKKG